MPNRSPPAWVITSLITYTVVNAAPTSTTNITGFFATCAGFSFTNDCWIARLRISGSNSGRARTPREMSIGGSSLVSGLRGVFCAVVVDIFGAPLILVRSEQFAGIHLEVFHDWTK